MCRVLKLEIKETQAELLELLRKQKTASRKERVQALYLLKSGQIEIVEHLAKVLGRGRVTVQRWLRQYREGGIESLLEEKKSPGRPRAIPQEVEKRLFEELKDPQGFKSYEEIRKWLLSCMGIEVSYKVVHETVRYKLKGKLKRPRPQSIKQKEGIKEEFKKNCQSG